MWSTTTLKKLAAGCDVVFLGRFVSFGELLNWANLLSEDALTVRPFNDDPAFLQGAVEQTQTATINAFVTPDDGSDASVTVHVSTAGVGTQILVQGELPILRAVRGQDKVAA